MSYEALRPEDALRARQRSFRDRVRRSGEIVTELFAHAERPYVAFSGGKDSTIVLALVRANRPEIPVVWSDDELIEPETEAFVRAVAGPNLIIVSGFGRRENRGHAGWFVPWTDEPFWRPRPAETIAIPGRTEEWSVAEGYDGAFVGLRGKGADEAWSRTVTLRKRGPVYYHEGDGQWRAHPLAGWSLADVWAYIAAMELSYNPAYDAMTRAGVPREMQRVGPLPLAPGWVLRNTWPRMFRRLVDRYDNRWGG